MQKVLNFYGGPGSGKSTLAASVFAQLKFRGYNVELVREYAKEWAWRGQEIKPEHQKHIFQQQYGRMRLLQGKVQLIITDSPLLLATIYGSGYDTAKYCYDTFQNCDLFVERIGHYNLAGRYQTYEEACELDKKCMDFADHFVLGDENGAKEAADIAERFINSTHKRDT